MGPRYVFSPRGLDATGGAFRFAVDPPDCPCQSDDKDAEGADLDDFSAQCVSVIEKWEVCGELPEWEVGNAKDGAPDDEGGVLVASDPVVADWDGGEESECLGEGFESVPGVGIEPEQAPEDRVDRCEQGGKMRTHGSNKG